MSDYRNPDDPLRRDLGYDPDARSAKATWGWVAGAALLVVLLAIAFGIGRAPNQPGHDTVANNTPPTTQPAPPPAGPTGPTFAPAPLNPTQPTPPGPPAPPRP